MVAGCPAADRPSDPDDNGSEQRLCVIDDDCLDGEACAAGVCVERASGDCTRDADCASADRCDVLSGSCVPRAGENGEEQTECEAGSTRCVDSQALEACAVDGSAWLPQTCEGVCDDGVCTVCSPGLVSCDASGAVETHARSIPSLVAFAERMRDRFFPAVPESRAA